MWSKVGLEALGRLTKLAALSALVAQVGGGIVSASAGEATTHALSLTGEPKYGPDAPHLTWVNPDAPKGGTLTQAVRGTFDSLHPFALKGSPATGLGLTIQSLLSTHAGEMSTEYPSIAQSVTVDDDLKYVRFDLDPRARFHDGSPITVADVMFSFSTLTSDKAPPHYRSYYGDVDRVEKTGDRQVTFHFTGPPNRELPQILGQLPIVSKAYWEGKDFGSTTLEPPLGSGPYRIKEFEAGRFIVYERVTDWWAADLLVNRGQYNFDLMRYDYYQDDNALRLAFQKGLSDFRSENTSLHWAKSYDFPAVQKGDVIKKEIADQSPKGMQGFVLNTRRAQFQDRRVRKALGLAFDFEWTNKERLFNAYTRTTSFFQNSDFAARGLPSKQELAYLEPLRDQLPPEVFTQEYTVPVTDGSGRNRAQLRQAKALLAEAGWTVGSDRVLRNAAGDAFQFTVMLISPAFERLVDPFLQNLRKLGVQADMRVIQQAEYVARLREFDFDVVVWTWAQSNSPGNEQRDFWGSAAASASDSRNFAGIQNPAIDALIEHIVKAQNREDLIHATRALDRALLWEYYVIPQWHVNVFRVAYWNRFGQPAETPDFGVGLNSWWFDPERAKAITSKRGE